MLSIFKSHYLINFNEIVLAFLPLESKTNIVYVKINFTVKLLFGFSRYRGKVVPVPAVSHPFWEPVLTKNVLSIFFSCLHSVIDSRNKRLSAFLLCFIGFETINFYIFFIKMSCFESNFFLNRELLIIKKNADTFLYSSRSWKSVQNFKANGKTVLVLALGEHDNLFTHFTSSSSLKFSLYSSFNLAKSTYSFYWCCIFSFKYLRSKNINTEGKTHAILSFWWTEQEKNIRK